MKSVGGGMAELVMRQAIAAAPKPSPDDYVGEDGLIHCHVCGEPRQTRMVWHTGKEYVLPVICRCIRQQMQEDEEAKEQEKFEEWIRPILAAGIYNGDVAKCSFEADDSPESEAAKFSRQYVKKWDDMVAIKRGVLFYGPVGTGKTYYAACIAKELLKRRVPVQMTNFSRLVNSQKWNEIQGGIDAAMKMKLLIIDDLGVERQTEAMQERVYDIIDARYRTGLPLILTTNLPIEQIKNPADAKERRIYDRVLEMCHPVPMPGKSRRRGMVSDLYAETKQILGV